MIVYNISYPNFFESGRLGKVCGDSYNEREGRSLEMG